MSDLDDVAEICAALIAFERALLRLAQERRTVRFGMLPQECGASGGEMPYIQVSCGPVYKGRTVGEALRAWAIATPAAGGGRG